MKNILGTVFLLLIPTLITAQNKADSNHKLPNSSTVIKKRYNFKSNQDQCLINIEYPEIISVSNVSLQKRINAATQKFFGLDNYQKAKNRLQVCPGEFYNKYQIYQSESFINIVNTVFSFPTSASHSNRFTNTLLLNPNTGKIISNNALFIHNNIDSLKHIIVNEIKSIYRKNKIESFDQDYYYKELDTFQFFVSKDNFTFYLDDYNEDFMGELEVPISKGRIAFCLKTIN